MLKRCHRNRSRSKRRPIYCPCHNTYLHSVSQKFGLYTTQAEHLQQRGLTRFAAVTVVNHYGTVSLAGEWLEEFWCDDCQERTWYHVRKVGERKYQLSPAPETLWRQATGVIDPTGNQSVGEFTRRQARQTRFEGVKDFRRIG